MRPEEIKRHLGKRVTLVVKPEAPGAPTVRGYLVGALDAADGLVVFIEPEGSTRGAVLSVHYHHILAISPAS
jgi:hypothetical protein